MDENGDRPARPARPPRSSLISLAKQHCLNENLNNDQNGLSNEKNTTEDEDPQTLTESAKKNKTTKRSPRNHKNDRADNNALSNSKKKNKKNYKNTNNDNNLLTDSNKSNTTEESYDRDDNFSPSNSKKNDNDNNSLMSSEKKNNNDNTEKAPSSPDANVWRHGRLSLKDSPQKSNNNKPFTAPKKRSVQYNTNSSAHDKASPSASPPLTLASAVSPASSSPLASPSSVAAHDADEESDTSPRFLYQSVTIEQAQSVVIGQAAPLPSFFSYIQSVHRPSISSEDALFPAGAAEPALAQPVKQSWRQNAPSFLPDDMQVSISERRQRSTQIFQELEEQFEKQHQPEESPPIADDGNDEPDEWQLIQPEPLGPNTPHGSFYGGYSLMPTMPASVQIRRRGPTILAVPITAPIVQAKKQGTNWTKEILGLVASYFTESVDILNLSLVCFRFAVILYSCHDELCSIFSCIKFVYIPPGYNTTYQLTLSTPLFGFYSYFPYNMKRHGDETLYYCKTETEVNSADLPAWDRQRFMQWSKSHNIAIQARWSKGIREGPEVITFPSGSVERRTLWLQGRKHGEELTFYPNGMMHTSCIFADGLVSGLEAKYYETGNMSYSCDYDLGKRNGEEKGYFKDMKKSHQCLWKDGLKIGKEVSFYADGQMASQCDYVNGEKEGEEIDYWPNGNRKYYCQWEKNKKHGTSSSWTQSGARIGIRFWKNGEPVNPNQAVLQSACTLS